MANVVPFFLTGANAKLKVNGVTLAFCTDLSYTVTVKHSAPKVLGMYEAYTIEPLGYEVTGTFTIIRYTKGLADYVKGSQPQTGLGQLLGVTSKGNAITNFLFGGESNKTNAYNPPGLVSNYGDGVGAWGPHSGLGQIAGTIGIPFSSQGRADWSFDPSKFQNSMMFDIEIFQTATPDVDGMFAKFRDCRITQADLHLTKKGSAVQTFRFQACYLDEDTFNATFSGTGQQLS